MSIIALQIDFHHEDEAGRVRAVSLPRGDQHRNENIKASPQDENRTVVPKTDCRGKEKNKNKT